MKTFEDTLTTASEEWVKDGLITPPQRDAILQRHPATHTGGGRFVAVLATVGALLFAVGVSLVIKANWEALGDWTKIGGLVVLLVAAYATGWRLKADGTYAKTGDAFLMIGALFFLCGIALVSQIFHLNARPASGVLLWWVGIAAVPWLTRAKGAQFVSIVAALVWLGMEMGTPGSLIHVWSPARSYSGRDLIAVQAVFVLLGLAVWFVGLGLRGTQWSDFAGLHEKWGMIVMCGALYVLGFARHEWNWSHPQRTGVWAHAWPAVALAVGLVGVAGLQAWRRSRGELKLLAPWIALTAVPVVGVIGIGWLGDDGWLWSAAAWVSLFTLSVAIVRAGLETGREGWVNIGIALIALNIITRYFDLFGTMLEGGVFFIVTGILVIGLGIYLEKKRRALVAAVRKEVQP